MARSKKAAGYVLPVEEVASSAPAIFPGFPGRFYPGEPLAATHLGLEEEEADARIAELGLPLQKVEVTQKFADAPLDRKDDDHRPSTPGGGPLPVDPETLTELTHDELDELAEEAGVEVEGTKAEKAETLADAGVAPPEETE